jgi:putative nucleotidyltransferase with HDIG domain
MQKDRIRESWSEWLSSNSRGWRILVGLVCLASLTLFLHFREVRLEVLELNATAGRYIVAQIDFEFPDYETTVLLRQQAMQDIGKVYQIDDKQIRDARYHLEDLLIHSKQWRQTAPSSTFEEMYKASDALETLLIEARFTDPRTIQKIKELSLPDFSYYEWIPDEDESSAILPDEFWSRLSLQLSQSDLFHTETLNYILQQFQEIQWTLVEDIPLEHALRSQVSGRVPEKLTHVIAGTRLVDQGEKITSRHLVMMQAMKQAISDSRRLGDPLSWLSSFIISLIFVTISTLYFRISQPDFIRSLRRISLFVCIVIITLLLAKLTEYILLKSTSTIIGEVRYPILAPFATVLICILLSPRTALFAATFLSIILSVSLAVDHSRFLVLNLVTSIVIIIASQGLRRRKEVFGVCIKSALSAIPVLYAFILGENHLWTASLFSDISASFVFLLITAILVVGVLPALETMFGILTDMSLVEYMDPNNELLREFAAAVPGTYQHSLVLGNLAEACARSIGANGLFCRSATLYHDVGKMNNPQFYTENQETFINMHQLLTPSESAQVIISHVKDGVEIAHKHRLPESFIEIIREHHGTTLVYYFYRKELDLKKGDKSAVVEKDFRYPGPKPRSKESAIIMICDSVEAASRSVDDPSEKALTEMIDQIVSSKAEDGQFDESELTFEELSLIKKSLVKSLLLTHHIRIKYPKR